MSGPDRSWTITPTLLWFGALLVPALVALDGGVQALADRMTSPRGAQDSAPAGPTFTARPTVVADAREDVEADRGVPAVGGSGANRGRGSALEDTCLDGTPEACTRWAMDGFYRAVSEENRGKLGRPVRVSWYGDSVVATDAIPARLRSRLQTELGDGGPGFVYVVPPHRFCHHEGIARTHTGAWETHAVSTQPSVDQLYGAGGASAETTDGKTTIKLVSGKVTRVDLHYLAQPRGGTAIVTADGTEVARADTAAAAKRVGAATASIRDGAAKIQLDTKGRVRVFGIGLENDSGAVVDNLGIVSVNVRNFAHRNEANFIAELDHRGADLIMIMIGANEAHWLAAKDSAMKAYQGKFEVALGPIRKARPNATCLVVSPLDQAEAVGDEYASRPVMPVLVEAQRKAARASGCAFFSTYDWMGGTGSAQKWFKRGLVGSDFTHLSRKGANKLADAVYDALMAGYRQHAPR